MKTNYFKYAGLVCISLIFACKSDKPAHEVEPNITITPDDGVFIINEGNYTRGNASVSYYNVENKAVIEDLFEPINKRLLGDTFQSMKIVNGKAYLVLNNSGKIEIVNAATFVSTGTINGFTSPRYFLPVSNGKAYVSDLWSNFISIVDLNKNTIRGSIPCKGSTEEMILSYGKVFVANTRSDKVYVINTTTDKLEDSIAVGYAPTSIVLDRNDKLWVLCAGKESTASFAGLYRIDPVTNKVEESMMFTDVKERPSRLKMNGTMDQLFYISKGGIYKMGLADHSLSAAPFIPRGTRNFYGLGINPKDDVIYVADALGYDQQGTVYRYESTGTLINSFKVGLIPNGFYFN